MTDFTDANRLIGGYHRARKCSGWKESCQKYGLSLLKNVRQLQKELRDGTYEQGQGSVFRLNENGHIRLVKALTVKDTVMQHSLCDNVLVPELSRHLIHDNGASLEGKGISFTRKRFEQHLRWHYRRYGTNGYILKIDFRKYFDNIQHDILSAQARPCIERFLFVVDTLGKILKANEVDISFTDEPDYIDQVFNSLEYQKIDPARLTGQQYMAKSMGIGAPTAQIAGIFLPTPIDTWCKTVRRVHCYDAYMDDRIIVHPDKEYLKELLAEIKEIAARLGIHINERKTQIVKLSHGFTFLKTKYVLTETGKIIRRIPRDVVVRQRRKMKRLARFVINGEMSFEAFRDQYKGWRGDKGRYHARRTLNNMDNLYRRLETWIRKTRPMPSPSRPGTEPSRWKGSR